MRFVNLCQAVSKYRVIVVGSDAALVDAARDNFSDIFRSVETHVCADAGNYICHQSDFDLQVNVCSGEGVFSGFVYSLDEEVGSVFKVDFYYVRPLEGTKYTDQNGLTTLNEFRSLLERFHAFKNYDQHRLPEVLYV